ncbi:MAG: CRISPR-associated endoribonuclease Cas6 [Candidatus Scalindua sp.]
MKNIPIFFTYTFTYTFIEHNMRHCRERIRSFKGTVIKCWTGHFWLGSEPEFLQFAFAAGLGSRNSGGFGFIEKVGER